MRGQGKMQGVKRGQTIVAERERAESDSERMQVRKQLRLTQHPPCVALHSGFPEGYGKIMSLAFSIIVTT